jgi:hypothetical protein
MNVGPVNTSIPSTPTSEGQNVNAAAQTADSNGGSVGINQNVREKPEDNDNMAGGAPEPLKQMSTSDFLTLHQASQNESVMDKLAKIFEAILALKLLEETVESVNKSIEESISEGE